MAKEKEPITGIPFIIDTDEGSVEEIIQFTDMSDATLTDYILDYPAAMAEWGRRLRAIEDESDSN
jgi:hypothetical protein